MRASTQARASTVAALVMAAACAPSRSRVPSTAAPTEAPAAEAPADAREAPGEVLEAVVPLIDGGTLDLATLHGTPVVLAMGVTTDEAFAPIRSAIEDLVARHDGELVVIVVATDAEAEAVSRVWPGGPDAVHLGWDPQGALATRLQVRTLPTLFVLDREGRVVVVRAGRDRAALDEVVAAADRAANGQG